MSVRMVILGLLREKPLYGYEIKQVIEEHMSDWTSIAFGSIYFALDKLSQEGFVEKVSVEKEGRRPSRSVYQINQVGRDEFLRLLREGWQQVEQQYFTLDLCLFFMHALPKEEILAYLRGRQEALRGVLQHIQDHRDEEMTQPEIPPIARAIFEHSIAHTEAELDWVTQLIEDLQDGKLS
jgi:DNA-binding PadR family transcriptional regulator